MSKTNIPARIVNQLLVKSAGRCEYRGCNSSLFTDIVTKRFFNQTYIAHIVADEPGGPRGDIVRSPLLAQSLDNLMLLCDKHHRLIDKIDESGHPESFLLKMKKDHEDRIERVTSIASDKLSHIIVYRANIGKHTPVLTYESMREYLLPEKYPATNSIIDLSLSNSQERDKDKTFWDQETSNLEKQFDRKLHQAFAKGEITHTSLFAFAPIPLLIKLGTLINEIHQCDLFQFQRSTKTWKLDGKKPSEVFTISTPKTKGSQIALVFSLSAHIKTDRITTVLGDDCSIYEITIANPSTDFVKGTNDILEFSKVIRSLFNQIKNEYNESTPIHVFPAMPISLAIELGRVWMPKADMPLILYDQNTALNGFSKALEISNT